MIYTHTTTYTKGYSLVEVLVAVAILMLAIVGPLTIAAKSIQSTQYARQEITAFFLAQEGISAVQALRNDTALAQYKNTPPTVLAWDWVNNSAYSSCFTRTGCNIDFRDQTTSDNVTDCASFSCALLLDNSTTGSGRHPLYKMGVSAGGPITQTPYTRVITLSKPNADEVLASSTVSWQSNLYGGVQTVSLQTSLLNVYK